LWEIVVLFFFRSTHLTKIKTTPKASTMVHFRCLLFPSLFHSHVFSVTVIPLALNIPRAFDGGSKPAVSDYDILSRVKPNLPPKDRVFVLNSFPNFYAKESASNVPVYGLSDSFVRGALEASERHQHYAFWADDVWLTILSQMNFYLRRQGHEKQLLEIFDNIRPSGTNPYIVFGFDPEILEPSLNLEMGRRNRTDWLVD